MAANADALRQAAIVRYTAVHTEATRLAVNELREVAPLGATGETRRQITSTPTTVSGPQLAANISAPAKGGEFVEEGTRPHVILPHGKALRFMASGGAVSTPSPNQRVPTQSGGVVFAKVVHHPGTPPRPWFHVTLAKWPEYLQRAMASV